MLALLVPTESLSSALGITQGLSEVLPTLALSRKGLSSMTCFNPRRPHQQASVGSLLTAVSGTQQGKHINVSSSVLTSRLSGSAAQRLSGSAVKPPPADGESQVQPLGQEDLLEKETATHSSIPACEITRTEEPGRLQSMGSPESWTQLSN